MSLAAMEGGSMTWSHTVLAALLVWVSSVEASHSIGLPPKGGAQATRVASFGDSGEMLRSRGAGGLESWCAFDKDRGGRGAVAGSGRGEGAFVGGVGEFVTRLHNRGAQVPLAAACPRRGERGAGLGARMSEEPHWPVAKWAVPRFWKFNEGRAGAGAKTPVSAAAQQPGGQGLGITHPLEALGSIPGGVVTTVGGTLGALLSNVEGLTRGGIKNVKNFRDVIGPKVEEKIREIMRRGDRELLGLNRASAVVDKPPVVMVLSGKDGEQQPSLLAYGEAIPELLYGMVQGAEMFSAPMQVSLSQDSKGNIFLGRPGRDEGTTLPMTSDVMWLRQMASYSFVDKNIGAAHHGSEPVTVAAVTLPVNERGDILVTQRASRGGMYNGLWVFPGGHVDGGERLADAAVREVREETGIDVRESSLRPVAIWEGAVSTRRKQFCVVFYAADATCENPLECTMQLQTKEVHRAVWVPREYVPRLLDTHVMHKDLPLHGILVEPDGSQVDVEVPLSEIQGGLGGGHKFALQKFLHGNPTYQKDDIKRSFSTKGRLETEEEPVWL